MSENYRIESGRSIQRPVVTFVISVLLTVFGLSAYAQEISQPNILFILSDDQGVDSSGQYPFSADLPKTPVIDSLAAEGLVFENAWATPVCATTRAAYLTGKHGVHSGVSSLGVSLDVSNETIYEFLAGNEATANYSSAYIGKWHLGWDDIDGEAAPVAHGIPYFAGTEHNIARTADYFDWPLTTDEPGIEKQMVRTNEYATSKLTRVAEDWIAAQDLDAPWFLTMAYHAPHGPIHWPPEELHTRRGLDQEACTSAGNGDPASRICFLAMIEALDFEIGNFLDHLSELGELENTLIFYVGDNGTSNNQRDPEVFEARTVKGSLYEGGVAVPFVVSGAGVTRTGEREDRLVNITDIFATIAEIGGADIGGSIYDSISIAEYLSSEDGLDRPYNYSEYIVPDVLDETGAPVGNSAQGWSVRNQNRLYMYDALTESEALYEINAENFRLIDVTEAEPGTLEELRQVASSIRED